jgi:hypothetical protein
MHAAITTLRLYKRTGFAALGAAFAVTATFLALPGSTAGAATAPLEPGQGTALAQTVKVDPRSGNLSIGITFGISIAGHQNTVAQASSQAINLGVIGTTLAGEGCDGGDPTMPADQQPQALQVDSRDEGADNFKTETDDRGFEKKARATDAPLGEAITTTAPYGIQGVITVGGGIARTTSGLVKDGNTIVREARATTDISGITLPGGIQLSSLHWEAVSRSGNTKLIKGSFSIGAATIGAGPLKQTLPTTVNAVLTRFGMQMQTPQQRETAGVLFVDPLGISVVPNTTRDNLFNTVLEGVQPQRQALFDALLEQDCGNATYITVFDIVLGSISGAGSFNLNLGGVQASTGEVPENAFDLGLGSGLPSIGPVDLGTPIDPGLGQTVTEIPGTPDIPGTDATTGGNTYQPAATVAPTGKRGPLAAVSLACLGLLALVAEGDRRKMRRAQREIPVDDQ